jgi:hypothetical protein
MTNGHLFHPHHMAWIDIGISFWPGLRYGLGMMTNEISGRKPPQQAGLSNAETAWFGLDR